MAGAKGRGRLREPLGSQCPFSAISTSAPRRRNLSLGPEGWEAPRPSVTARPSFDQRCIVNRAVSADEPSRSVPLVWVGVDDLPVYFLNQFLGQADGSEVYLTLGQVVPPALFGQ